jgi:hypothetical protein
MGELDKALSPVPGEELSTGLGAPDGLEVRDRARVRVREESCKDRPVGRHSVADPAAVSVCPTAPLYVTLAGKTSVRFRS